MNIVASNGYFDKKRSEYLKSEIEVTRIFVTNVIGDWTLENIKHRDNIVVQDILQLLEEWETSYKHGSSGQNKPTQEGLNMIEKFK